MKNLVPFIILVLATLSVTSQTTVPNGDFEEWTDQFHILHWDGLNYDGSIINFHTFSRTDDAHSGNYAAQVETIHHDLIGTLPGMAFTGNIDFDPVTFEYTFTVGVPVEGRPSSLKGFFKYNPAGGDTMAIVIGMFRWNTAQMDLDSIGGGYFFTGDTVNNYTAFEAPIEYFDPTQEADTMYIMMFSSLDSYHVGSVLRVDDLTLSYGSVGIEDEPEEVEVAVFPNPVNDFFQVSTSIETGECDLIITDLAGRVVARKTFEKQMRMAVPQSMSDGLYFATVRKKGLILKTTKFMIKR